IGFDFFHGGKIITGIRLVESRGRLVLSAGHSTAKGSIQSVQRKAGDYRLRRGRRNGAGPRMTMLVAYSAVEARKLLLEMLYLWQVEGGYVGVVGMIGGIVLVVVFGAIEGLEGDDLGDDWMRKHFSSVELLNVSLDDALLIGRREENCGAVLRAAVWALAIQFCGVVGYGEKYFQEL